VRGVDLLQRGADRLDHRAGVRQRLAQGGHPVDGVDKVPERLDTAEQGEPGLLRFAGRAVGGAELLFELLDRLAVVLAVEGQPGGLAHLPVGVDPDVRRLVVEELDLL